MEGGWDMQPNFKDDRASGFIPQRITWPDSSSIMRRSWKSDAPVKQQSPLIWRRQGKAWRYWADPNQPTRKQIIIYRLRQMNSVAIHLLTATSVVMITMPTTEEEEGIVIIIRVRVCSLVI